MACQMRDVNDVCKGVQLCATPRTWGWEQGRTFMGAENTVPVLVWRWQSGDGGLPTLFWRSMLLGEDQEIRS